MTAPPTGLAELDQAALLQAAFDLQDQRDAARAQLDWVRELAATIFGPPVYCPSVECTIPACRLARILEGPTTA